MGLLRGPRGTLPPEASPGGKFPSPAQEPRHQRQAREARAPSPAREPCHQRPAREARVSSVSQLRLKKVQKFPQR